MSTELKPGGPPQPDPEVEYASYIGIRSEAIKLAVELSGRFDKWMLALSGGALIGSVTFLEKIAHVPKPCSTVWLAFAWVFLILSVISSVVGLLCGQYSVERDIECLDWEHDQYCKSRGLTSGITMPTKPGSNRQFRLIAHITNIIAPSGFILGLMFLAVFAIINVPSDSTTEGHSNMNRNQPDPGADPRTGRRTYVGPSNPTPLPPQPAQQPTQPVQPVQPPPQPAQPAQPAQPPPSKN